MILFLYKNNNDNTKKKKERGILETFEYLSFVQDSGSEADKAGFCLWNGVAVPTRWRRTLLQLMRDSMGLSLSDSKCVVATSIGLRKLKMGYKGIVVCTPGLLCVFGLSRDETVRSLSRGVDE